jgi:alkanesulfonate monooxygenase
LSFSGRHFQISDYQLRPDDHFRARPAIYIGGESAPAQDLAADYGDVWFINGQPIANVEHLIASARARKRAGPPLRFGLSAFVITRETAAEAQAAYAHLAELAERDAPIRARQAANTDPSVVMKHTHAATTPRIGTNGGTAAGLVGSYGEVASRIRVFHAAGIELFMLQFQPFEAEMRRFAREIFPRVAT